MTDEQLKQLEASHVALMTEHELFVKEQDKAWDRHNAWLSQFEKQRERDRAEEKARGEELDKRIAALVSGIGEFIRMQRKG